MAKLMLEVGDVVAETYDGFYSHREHHGEQNLKAKVFGFPFTALVRRPKILWRGRRGKVLEVQGRWWGQDGYDVRIQWNNGGEPEWRLADDQHLTLIRKARAKSSVDLGESSSQQ